MMELSKIINQKISTSTASAFFYLTYLIFYFSPWLIKVPDKNTILFSTLIICLYIPIHFLSFSTFANIGNRRIIIVYIIEILAIISAPLHAMNGVFHIYAAAQSAYQTRLKSTSLLFLSLTIIYSLTSYYFGRTVMEIMFVNFMALIIWLNCIQDANLLAQNDAKERTRQLEKQQASITERERISQDLHDLLGHTLTMISIKSDLAQKHLNTVNIKAANNEIQDIGKTSRKALSDIRAVLSDMYLTSISHELENAKQALQTAEIKMTVNGIIPAIQHKQEQALALAIRESVTNIIRHSNAKMATISFSTHPTETILHISDNGISNPKRMGKGLTGLKTRIEQIGGCVQINLKDGVIIIIRLPHGSFDD